MSATRVSSGVRWKPWEDDLLRENVTRITASNASHFVPGRSATAVRNRLSLLGLYRPTERFAESYALSEVSAIIGVPRSTLDKWVRAGLLPHTQVPRLVVGGHGVRMVVEAWALDDFITAYPFLFDPTTFPPGPHRSTLIMARPQDWLCTKEVARLLDVSVALVRRLTRTGRIPHRFFRSLYYFHRRDVEHYREQRARQRMAHPAHARALRASKERRRMKRDIRFFPFASSEAAVPA